MKQKELRIDCLKALKSSCSFFSGDVASSEGASQSTSADDEITVDLGNDDTEAMSVHKLNNNNARTELI